MFKNLLKDNLNLKKTIKEQKKEIDYQKLQIELLRSIIDNYENKTIIKKMDIDEVDLSDEEDDQITFMNYVKEMELINIDEIPKPETNDEEPDFFNDFIKLVEIDDENIDNEDNDNKDNNNIILDDLEKREEFNFNKKIGDLNIKNHKYKCVICGYNYNCLKCKRKN